MKTKTHVKTDHAHKVFDKMPRALRQVLEWPKTPDGGLFRCKRVVRLVGQMQQLVSASFTKLHFWTGNK